MTRTLLPQRERAWKIFPYPCVGLFHFLSPTITLHACYPEIVQRLQNGQKLLDLGCGFAQDIRKLVYDGARAENLYGVDIHSKFIDLGYDLFKDRETLKSQFLIADIFDPESMLKTVHGEIDIVHAWAVFHLFDWEGQVEAGKRVVRMLRARRGSLLVGGQAGRLKPGLYGGRPTEMGTMWLHDEETWKELWRTIGEATGTVWKVEVQMDVVGVGPLRKADPKVRRLLFTVERVGGDESRL